MIKPTVGRIVHFYEKRGELPKAAIVAHVWSNTCVNLSVFDANGVPQSKTSVFLVQDDDPQQPGGYYAEWMPYQKGQAAKTEELEARLGEASAGTPQGNVPPHILRVIQEKNELATRHQKLGEFMVTGIFLSLDAAEQDRLKRQFHAMDEYLSVLNERIAAFTEASRA